MKTANVKNIYRLKTHLNGIAVVCSWLLETDVGAVGIHSSLVVSRLLLKYVLDMLI
jgi:hypothetical protein